jgi:hypothetical protein
VVFIGVTLVRGHVATVDFCIKSALPIARPPKRGCARLRVTSAGEAQMAGCQRLPPWQCNRRGWDGDNPMATG